MEYAAAYAVELYLMHDTSLLTDQPLTYKGWGGTRSSGTRTWSCIVPFHNSHHLNFEKAKDQIIPLAYICRMSNPDALHMSPQLTGLSIGVEKDHCYGADGVLKNYIDGHADEGRSQSGGEDKLEPIAIIGMGLKFPQDATTPEAFWEMMLNGKSARSDVPSERFDINGFYRSFGAKSGQVR